MKNFYTASEAQQRLGMDKNSFYYLVRKGTFKGVTPPGKKHSLYPKSEIDKFAASIKTLMEQYGRETSSFEKATPDDLQAEVEIDISLYGNKGTTPLEARLTRLQANLEGNYVLRNEGEIVGHISFYPVEPITLREATTGERHGIPADKILLFEPEKPLSILIFVISVKSGFPPDVTNHYGQRLIAGTVHILKQLGERGVEIENIYATSRTASGIKLCRKLGMLEEAIPNEKGRYRYSLHIPSSNSLLVQEYKQGLAEYKQLSK
jgi:Helix-turn-helix domain